MEAKKRERMKKHLRYFRLILIIAGILSFAAIAHFCNDIEFLTLPQKQKEIYYKTIAENNDSFNNAIKKFENDIILWSPNINEVVDDLSSFKGCVKLCYCLAKDKINGTSLTENEINKLMTPIEMEAIGMFKYAENSLMLLREELEENGKQMIAESSSETNEFDLNFAELNKKIEDSSVNLRKIALSTVSSSVGLSITVLSMKMILRQIKTVLAAIVKRYVSIQVASGACVVADGPFPFGDAIAVIIEIGGTAWAAYELYKAQKVLKTSVKKSLEEGVKNYKEKLRIIFNDKALELLGKFKEQDRKIIIELNTNGG